jgi:hypothetical protein
MTAAAVSCVVRWVRSSAFNECSECFDRIWPGESFARYTEETAANVLTNIKRVYCRECGHLLEDSLATTETL